MGLLREGVPRPGPVEFVDSLVRDGLWCSVGHEGMGEVAERSNVELGVGRQVQDEVAERSQRLAAAATDSGRLALEIVPVRVGDAVVAADEGIRRGVTLGRLAALRPAFRDDGTITAGNASQMTDGACVGAVTSRDWAERAGRAGVTDDGVVVSGACRPGPEEGRGTSRR